MPSWIHLRTEEAVKLIDAEAAAHVLRVPLDAYTDWLEIIRDWAEQRYPHEDPIKYASFATLLYSFITGLYGRYGTEDYDLERRVENLILAFAGGEPLDPGSVIAITP